MTRTRFGFVDLLLVVLIIISVLVPASAYAAPPPQDDDPCAQCAEGDRLFREGRYAEALPLLEAGFAGREHATCADSDEMGFCALALGYIRSEMGDENSALEAFAVACEIFRSSGNRDFEGVTLHNIGGVYDAQGRYAEALEMHQQALAIWREVDDRAQEGTALNKVGLVYDGQGRYAKALENFQQALVIWREMGNRAGEGITLHYIGSVYANQGHYAKALETYQQALAIRREVGDQTGEGVTSNNIGGVYRAQGRYAEALEMYQQALDIMREVGDRAGEGVTLNNIGSVYYARGRYAEALEMYQQALTILREVGNRAGEGETLNNIGTVYQAQGRYAEALEMYLQALVIRQEMGDRAGEGTTLNNIGAVYQAQGRYAEALEMLQKDLIICRELGDRPGEGTTFNNIGDVYRAQGRYVEALERYQQALAIFREVGDRAGEGGTLHNIGALYTAQGRYVEALEMYQQALTILREVGNRVGEGNTLISISVVYRAQGRYTEALEMYQQALAIHREVGNQAEEGITLHNIGVVYATQGRYAGALEMYQQALTIHREVGNRPREGTTLGDIGAVYQAQTRYPEALEILEQALVIHREVGDHIGEGYTLGRIGAVYIAQGRYVEALEMYQQALAIFHEASSRAEEGTTLNNIGNVYSHQGHYVEALEMYQQALAIRREVGNPAGEGTTLGNIGAVYQAQARYAEALVVYQQAMDTVEAVRAVAGSELGRAAFIAQYADLYARAADLFHQQGQDAEAFFTSERGRARAFLDSLATGQVELTDIEAAALLEREQEAYAGRQAAQDALARARALDPPDPALVADLEAQLAQAEAAYAKALADIEARGDELAALVPGRTTVLALSDVQILLDEETTLVSYFVLGDETLAFLITYNSFHTVALGVGREELSTQIRAFRDFPNLNVAHPNSAVTLYGWLIEPLKEYFPSTSSGQGTTPHLAIVPHSVLHYLPFAALTDGQRYLLDDYVITYLPSASTLPFIQANVGGEPGSPFVLGNPATDDPNLRPLTFAEQEAQAIAALYDVQPLLSEAATESTVRERASQASILHLATHGSYNRYNPLYSAITLAPDGENDRQLEVREVYGLDLKNTDLVVLSACETQLGELGAEGEPVGVSPGDEVVGLMRAFIFAGTPSVIASLWSVDDRSTGILMERFYTYLQEGMGKAEALRQAQLDVRAKYPNPYYWSGFVLSGEPGEMSGYQPPARQMITSFPSVEVTTAPVEETPKAEEKTAPAKGGRGPCPAGALILALGVGVAFITKIYISS